ncbi:ABC transporter permease [Tumebacillus lipolyticus]|uniref:ABC transporter permease n=1 Tax=Tumebacillus lipolyticus TaxID=1280370 RepID=A0ABW4ZYK8_9BACL
MITLYSVFPFIETEKVIDLRHRSMQIIRRQFISYPAPTIFLMIGFVISFLLISFGTSSFVQLKNMTETRNNNVPPHGIALSLSIGEGNFQFDKWLDSLNRLENDTGLIFTGLKGFLDDADSKEKVSLRAEWFKSDLNWKYILMEGRYYSPKEVMSAQPVVLLGKNLQKLSIREGSRDVVMVSGRKYEVIGILGKKNEKTNWDNTIVMPVTALPETTIGSIESSRAISMILHKESKLPMKELSLLEDDLKRAYSGSQIQAEEVQKELDYMSTALANPDFVQVLSVLVYVLALINSVNVTSFWMNERKYEIGVRKAFGHTNFTIMKLLMAEMLLLISISAVGGIGIHLALDMGVGSIAEYTTQFYLENIIVAVIFVALSTFLTAIIPALKCIKLQPIEALKK